MPTGCGALSADLLKDCDNKPVGGAEPLLWLITKDDWNNATIVRDAQNPNLITAITLASGGKKAYQMSVFKRGHKPKFEAQDSDYGNYWKHSIDTYIATYTDAVKQQLQALAEGYVVAIVENVQKTGVPFEVYGADYGLRMSNLARDLSANEGTVTGTFTNDDGMNERYPPATLKIGASYASTKAGIIALTTPTT